MLKKKTAFILALILTLSTVMGCSSNEGSGKESGDTDTQIQTQSLSETGTDFGEVDTSERITLTVCISDMSEASYLYEDNEFTQYICDLNNIDLEFVTIPTSTGDAGKAEQLALLMSSGTYPDIIFRSGFTLAEQKLYGKSGMLINLYPLYEEYGDNFKRAYEEYPEALEGFMVGEKEIYDLPSVNDCYHCAGTMKAWVYEPWLEALDLKEPTTLDEFKAMLIAFTTEDPNGNGINDELGLVGYFNGWESDVVDWVMQSFVYPKEYVGEDGQIILPYTTDAYKDGLAYLKELYDEGLIYPESFTLDYEKTIQLSESSEDVIIGTSFGGYQGNWIRSLNMEEDNIDWYNYITLAPLEGYDNQEVYSFYNPYDNFYASFSITDACEDPVRAFLLADSMMSAEAQYKQIGKEGVVWEYVDDPAILGLNGEPALYQYIVRDDTTNPDTWNGNALSFRTDEYRLGTPYVEGDGNSMLEKTLYDATAKSVAPYYLPGDMLLPDLALDEADASEIALIETSLNDYLIEMKAAFITGERDLETYWDTYLSELDKIGISRWLEIKQSALDERNN